AGDALELALAVRDELIALGEAGRDLLLLLGDLFLAAPQLALEPIGLGEAVGQRAGLVGEDLLEGGDLLLALAGLAFGIGGDLVGLFARLEHRFLAGVLRVAL